MKLFAALILAVSGLHAATVEVRLQDERGTPLRGAGVRLYAVGQRGSDSADTDANGVAVFPRVPPGRYRFQVWRTRESLLVKPRHDPSSPPLAATVTETDRQVRVEATLRYGSPVVLLADLRGGDLEFVQVEVDEIDTGQRFRIRLRIDGDRQVVLLPGRWRARLETPPGYLLTDVEVDGLSVPGHRIPLQLESHSPARFVTWYLRAPALIEGSVAFAGAEFPIAVEATLVTPGPWIDAARARGGSQFEVVRAGPDGRGRYEMFLPDGAWDVRPVSDELVSSEPETVALEIEPGGVGRADFRVRGAEADGQGATVVVHGRPGDARPLHAGLWTHQAAAHGEAPAAEGRDRGSRVRLRNVAPAAYVVAAWAPGYVETRRAIEPWDPQESRFHQVTVTLSTGGELHATVADGAGKPVPQVRLSLERTGEPFEGLLRDDDVLAAQNRAEAHSDATGHIWLRGIFPGRYVASARLEGNERGSSHVRVLADGRLREEVELTFAGEGRRELELRVEPAGRIATSLACTDGEPLPGVVALAALDRGLLREHSDAARIADEGSWPEEALLWSEPRQTLTGRGRDRVVAGPLARGSYALALRPNGFARWTWAGEGEHPAEAAAVPVDAARATDLGLVHVDCGPAIELLPTTADGAPLPDLRASAPTLAVSGTVRRERHVYDVRRAHVDAWPDRLRLRELPAGEADLTITLSSPYFLPNAELEVAASELELEPAGMVTLRPRVPGIGGILSVDPPADAAALRLTSDGFAGLVAVDHAAARTVIANLPAADYRLEYCADAACAAVVGEGRAQVRVLETTHVGSARLAP